MGCSPDGESAKSLFCRRQHGWHPKTLAVSLWALATVYLFFSMAIWLEVGNLLVPLTGGVTYLELAVLSLICGAVARRLT